MSASELRRLHRILVIRLDNVGDVVMLSPALRALRDACPQARITAMLSPAGATVAPLLPWIDDVIMCRAPWQDASGSMPFAPETLLGVSRELSERGFDAAFIFTSFSQSPWPPAYACYLAGIPVRVGESREFGGSILSHNAPSLPDAAHQVDRNLHLLRSVGIAAEDGALALAIPPDARERARSLLARADITGPFLLLAPGASCPARRYEASRFAEAARTVAAATGMRVVVAGSEREQELCASVTAAIGPVAVSVAGETSIPALAAVIERAELVVANDSGPMHIADALRRPMVILYSGTELESQWKPRSAPARLLLRPTDCAPCHRFECPYAMECLDIPPEEVAEAALAMLGSRARWEVAV